MNKFLPFLGVPALISTLIHPASSAVLQERANDPHQFMAGAEVFYYRYREPKVMKTHGALYGAKAAYNYTFCNGFFIQPDGRFAYGRTNYSSDRTGSMKNEPNWIAETRVVAGKRFKLGSQTEISPYTGVGYRYKRDDSGGRNSSTGHTGYLRESHYLYLPVGVTLHQALCWDNWFLSPTFEYDVFLRGRQKSKLKGRVGTVNHTQKRGYGLKGEIDVTKRFEKASVSFGPFVNYWHVDDSNVVKGYIEPDNNTLEVGGQVKITF